MAKGTIDGRRGGDAKEVLVNAAFALIHSPLVGPTTWVPVADELRRLGFQAIVPALADDDASPMPYWQQEVVSVVATLQRSGHTRPLVVVGHSGAGALLPAIGQRLRDDVAGYVYVDAVLPLDGASRLDEMSASSPEFAVLLRQQLEDGKRAPIWTDDDLRPFIPDDDLRRRVVSEVHPRPLAFYEESIPSSPHWPRATSGYILFSPTYASAAERAARYGWDCRHIQGGHFHMLVDPPAVANALVEITESW